MSSSSEGSAEPSAAPPSSVRRSSRRSLREGLVLLAALIGAFALCVGGFMFIRGKTQPATRIAAIEARSGASASTTTPNNVPNRSTAPVSAANAGIGATVSSRPIDNRIFAVGDSVLQGAATFLPDALPDWSIDTDTRVGRFTPEGAAVIARNSPRIGQVVVISLGNNYGGDRLGFADQVDGILKQLASVRHVLWLTVSEFRANRVEVNDVLRAAARTHPNLTLVDWTPLWLAAPELTASDRLHLTGTGAQIMANLMAITLRDVLVRAGEVPLPGPGRSSLHPSGAIPTTQPKQSSGGAPSSSARAGGTDTTDRSRSSTTTSPQVAESPADPAVDPTSPPPAPAPTAPPTTIDRTPTTGAPG